MTLGDLIRTASSNLGRRKVRTALTTLGIVVGITTIVAMLSLAVGVQREIRKQFEAIGLENVFVEPTVDFENFTRFTRPERTKPITQADVARWRELPGVAEVRAEITIPNSVSMFLVMNGREQAVRVADGDLDPEPFEVPPAAVAGVMEPAADDQIVLHEEMLDAAQRTPEGAQALLGQQVEILLVTPRGESQRFSYTVAGVINGERRLARLSVAARGQIKSWWFNIPDIVAEEGYDSVTVRAVDIVAARQITGQIRGEGFEVRSLETILDVASRVFAVINMMLGSVGGLALFVASIGIINTMIMAIYERTREIGTLKAIGASRRNIGMLFMFEAGMIGMLGSVIGLLLGWLIGLILNQAALWYLESEQIPIRGTFFVLPLWLVLLALTFGTLVGVFAGLYPAYRAARLDPLQALRHE